MSEGADTPEIPGFTLKKPLGSGGFATVWLAEQQGVRRDVAIKILDAVAASDQVRFEREARVLGALEEPYIIRVYDVGVVDGRPWIAMEYHPGGDLKSLIRSGTAGQVGLPPEQALKLTRQIALGLARAHEKGIIHRDVKPENILLSRSGDAVLVDFGIARRAQDASVTKTGAVIGTPAYISVDLLKNLKLDGRSDLYSLGAVFHEMLTGHPPFGGCDVPVEVVLLAHLQQPVPRLPAGLERCQGLLDGLMAKSRSERFPDALVVADVVESILDSGPFAAAPSAGDDGATMPFAAPGEISQHPPGFLRDARRWWSTVALCAGLILVGVGAWWVKDQWTDPSGGAAFIAPDPVEWTAFMRLMDGDEGVAPNGVQHPVLAGILATHRVAAAGPAKAAATIQKLQQSVQKGGDPVAPLVLAHFLGTGIDGVLVPDLELAASLAGEQADKGSAVARFLRARILLDLHKEGSPAHEAAVLDLQALADEGFVPAQWEYAMVRKLNDQAVPYLRRAASVGFAPAQLDLARHYAFNVGGQFGYSCAFVWSQAAQGQGYPGAANFLAQLPTDLLSPKKEDC